MHHFQSKTHALHCVFACVLRTYFIDSFARSLFLAFAVSLSFPFSFSFSFRRVEATEINFSLFLSTFTDVCVCLFLSFFVAATHCGTSRPRKRDGKRMRALSKRSRSQRFDVVHRVAMPVLPVRVCVCVCFTSLFRFILCDHSPLLLAMEEENRAHRRSRPVFTFLISCAVVVVLRDCYLV